MGFDNMKHELQILVRFETKEARDALYEHIKQAMGKFEELYDNEDSYIRKVKCFHDEHPHNPCELEEEVKVVKKSIDSEVNRV